MGTDKVSKVKNSKANSNRIRIELLTQQTHFNSEVRQRVGSISAGNKPFVGEIEDATKKIFGLTFEILATSQTRKIGKRAVENAYSQRKIMVV